MSPDTLHDLAVLAPVLAALSGALLVLLLDAFRPDGRGLLSGGLALAALGGAAACALTAWPTPATSAFLRTGVDGTARGALTLDAFGMYVTWIVLIAAAATVAVSLGYTARWHLAHAEYFALLLICAAGMMALALASDLIVLFLLLEAFSLALYVLCGMASGHRPGLEAATKYFIAGSVAAAFLLYGIALAYGATGSTHLQAISSALSVTAGGAAGGTPRLLALVAMGLLLVGLAFKAAIAPFHQWAPDVYEGAPTPITGFMAGATKAVAFAALARVLWVGFADLSTSWVPVLSVVAVVSMLVGNLTALVQSDVKRMLGYSAVAQAGYVLAALLAGTAYAVAAALFYLLAYALMNIGVIAVLLGIGAVSGGDATHLDDLRGLSRRHAGLSFALAVFLLSLAGLPPTLGFVGKWYIFDALVQAGQTPMAVVIVLNTALAAIYYARPVLYAYAGEPRSELEITVSTPTAVVTATAALVVGLGVVFAGPLIDAARASAQLRQADSAAAPAEPGAPGLFFTAPTFEKGKR